MKLFLKSIYFILFFLPAFHATAQVGFAGGYNFGKYTAPMHNMEIMTYEFNKDHPNYDNLYNFTNIYHGFTLSLYKNGDKFGKDGGTEFIWSNKTIKTTAKGADNPGDTVFKHQVRVSMNTFSLGWYLRPNDHLKLGIDYDAIGLCRFMKRVGPDDGFKNEKWQRIFDRKGFFVFGFTFFAEGSLGPLKVRPYYQWILLPMETHYGLLKDYSFKCTNYGISVFIGIDGKDE